jgi:glycylpeptide N-tetradecanoyltransferase
MKKKKIDMVNVMKQYDNYKFIDTLKFKQGNVDLNFYFYNWQCPQIEQNDMAIIMV